MLDAPSASLYARGVSVGVLEVGVVGAGTAGAATAVFLARAGHRVTLFEAVPRPGPVGAGIMMQPTGMSVLERLGVLPQVIERGSRLSGLSCVQHQGKPVLELTYARIHPGAFGLGLHRGVLFDALFGAAMAEPGVELRTGIAIEGRTQVGPRHQLLSARGEPVGEYDLVVVANGARSALRHATGLTRRDRAYPWGALWCILPDRAEHGRGKLRQVVRGTRHMLGFLPSGLGPSGDTPQLSLFWSVRAAQVAEVRAAGLEAFKDALRKLDGSCAPLLEQLVDMDQLLFARYHDVVMRRWHLPSGVVVLGDAAHAMSPQLGQGANLALVDAATLADVLASAASLPEALATYSRARRRELQYYQWATRFLTPFFQSNASVLGWLRDGLMYPLGQLPLVASKMLRTLCGVERGILLGAPRPLPLVAQLPPAASTR